MNIELWSGLPEDSNLRDIILAAWPDKYSFPPHLEQAVVRAARCEPYRLAAALHVAWMTGPCLFSPACDQKGTWAAAPCRNEHHEGDDGTVSLEGEPVVCIRCSAGVRHPPTNPTLQYRAVATLAREKPKHWRRHIRRLVAWSAEVASGYLVKKEDAR